MINLQSRSEQKEMLDADNIPFADIRQNMQELNTINRLLGGHRISISAVKALIPLAKEDISIAEIGCGGGDNLYAIHQFLDSQQIKASFTGIDIKKECIDFARQQYPQLPANWICSDYRDMEWNGQPPAILFSSLFCHHFSEAALVYMLQWMQQHSRAGFFINDLHRHPLAYYSIKWLTRFFSRSYLVQHDAPLSVARGFTKKDWVRLLGKAGIDKYTIEWKWAFRWLISCKK